MKTEEFIATLVADQRRVEQPMTRSLSWVAMLAGLFAFVVMFVTIGVRSDLLEAATSWRFLAKLAIVALALGLALVDCVRASSPLATGYPSHWSLVLPAIVLLAIGAELVATTQQAWGLRLVGSNALLCLVAIPALALVPLVAGLHVMKHGAPAFPVAAGLAVGRLAAAIAAVMYALHCVDDSPLFVATWYSLAMMPVIAVGAFSGRFMLRW
ncbi:MAG: NrsF family protein [Hyphomicrobiaceae bacterium]